MGGDLGCCGVMSGCCGVLWDDVRVLWGDVGRGPRRGDGAEASREGGTAGEKFMGANGCRSGRG